MKRTFTTLIFFIILGSAVAQADSTIFKSIYEKETIYFSGSRNKYLKGDIKYPIKSLAEEFRFSPEGKNLYQLSVMDSRKQILSASIGLGMFVSGLILVNNDQKPLGAGLFFGSVVPNIISLKFGIRSMNKQQKAVWIRNRDVLLQGR